MTQDEAILAAASEPFDVETFYRDDLESCRRLDVQSVSRERALGLIREWTEVLSGRPGPTTP